MKRGTLAALTIGSFLVVPGIPALAQQQCVPYEPDPRLEAQFGDPVLTQADALVTLSSVFQESQSDPVTTLMNMGPWIVFHAENVAACTPRDYHGQPGPGTLGSGVLVGSNLVLTAGHLVVGNQDKWCEGIRIVFGFGNFTPDQWSCGSYPCALPVPAADLYSCQSVRKGTNGDWALVTLDRAVQGRNPLPILRTGPFPPVSTPVTLVGHPNRIPMKVQYASVNTACPTCIDAPVRHGNSGSMVVDDASGKVIGIATAGPAVVLPGCDAPSDPPCHREWFSNPNTAAFVTPAWLAEAYIP